MLGLRLMAKKGLDAYDCEELVTDVRNLFPAISEKDLRYRLYNSLNEVITSYNK